MRVSKILKTACVATLAIGCVCAIAGCSGNNSESSSSGVAATVNGTEISEEKITNYIESIRSQMSLDDEDSWGEWLAEYSYTPESVREQIIDSYVEQELIRQGAAEKGITVDSSTIDEYVNSMKSNYDDDEAWQEALTSAGMTEDEYRQNIELSLLYTDLYATFASDEEPAEEDLLTYAQSYATSYDGAKRSSHILFSSDDEATAQEVLDKINSGELDFAAAAEEYSTDTSSASEGGDVGWDKLTSFVDEYQEALDGLEKDQVSGLVTSSYGIHIIKCTDVFTAPEEVTSTDQIPEEFLEQIKSSIQSSNQSTAYQEWLDEYKENSDIVINDMPEGLSYYVDMSKYETEDEESTDTSTDTSSDTTSSDTSSDTTSDTSSTESSTTESTEATSSDSTSSETSTSTN